LFQEIGKQKNVFRDDFKKEVENKTPLKQMVPLEINRQTWSDVNRANRNNCFLFR